MVQVYPKTQKHVYNVPFFAKEHEEFVLWFFTGSRCNLECTHCYVESGPRANKHPILQFNTFKTYLDEALACNYNKLDIYFTGGEPFINPDLIRILEEALKYGDTTVLTNATRITDLVAKQLAEIQKYSNNKLFFRVSLDGPDAESNDTIRGKYAFKSASSGLKNLVNQGFNPIVTITRLWPNSQTEEIKKQFSMLLEEMGIPSNKQLLKILPPLRIGREALRDRPYTNKELFTEQCFVNYDYSYLQCSKCRIISEKGVWVCPILINEDGGRMGDNLAEAARQFPMTYLVCWTCRMEGMNCSND